MRQVARALLVTVGGLLLVPYAINVQTGGVPPAWLRPYAAALWPAALLCVAALAALEIAARRRVLLPLIPSRQDTRNVARAREHIIAYVGERRRGLLAARIALTLQERPDAVRAPVNLVQRDSDGEEVRIDASFRMADLFRSMDGSLLILGAPGAGKTTMLLDLAAELVEDDDGALPVVIDLAGWGRPRPRRFADWLFASLAERYRIPPSVGRAWLHADRLTLLLDGLDELEVGRREQCVTEIDELQADYGVTRVVVCSRVADYDRLTARLRAQGAVLIRPLTRQQVESFLGDRGLTDLLQDDAELWEVLTTPLMLTAVLAAQDDQRWRLMLAGRYRPKSLISADAEWIRRHLVVDAYVVEALSRQRAGEIGPPEHVLPALITLARAGERADVTVHPMHHTDVFYALPDFPTDLLRTWVVPGAAAIAALTAAAVLGHIATTGLAAAVVLTCAAILLAVPARPAPAPELRNVRARVLVAWAVLVAAVTSGYLLILAPLAAGVAQRRPLVASVALGVVLLIEVLLAWRELAGRWITGYSMLVGVLVAVGVGTGPPVPGAVIGLLAGALCAVVLLFCSTTHIVAQPPRGIASRQAGQRTRQREVLLLVVAAAVLLLPWSARFAGAGLAAAMVLAGMLVFYPIAAALSHPLLRYSARIAIRAAHTPDPWSQRFLGYAADRGLLVKAGGRYRFPHRLVRRYLAAAVADDLVADIRRRREQQ